jgi:hypothetical protein
MSSSFRKAHAIAATFALCGALLVIPDARSQQVYFIPQVELSSEYHTNRELISIDELEDPTIGYIATAQARWGRRTPRSENELRPMVRFQEYPDRGGVDPWEAHVDLRSNYRTERGFYSLIANYIHEDAFNAEFGQAGFDPTVPDAPDVSDTGIVFLGVTRQSYMIRPAFQYQLSNLTRAGLGVLFRDVSYDKQDIPTQRVGYQDGRVDAFLGRQLGPRMDLRFGPYYDQYETESNTTRSGGAAVALAYDWSERSQITLGLQGERSKIEDNDPTNKDELTNWGFSIEGRHTVSRGEWHYSAGRYLTPSSRGSKTERFDARVENDHALGPRWKLETALRAGRERRLGAETNQTDRDFARASMMLNWLMTRTWRVSAGYKYAWQDRKETVGVADDNAFILSFIYRDQSEEQPLPGRIETP